MNLNRITYSLLDEIESIGSTLEKQRLFEKFSRTKINQTYIRTTFNGTIYGVAKKTVDKAVEEAKQKQNPWFTDYIDDKSALLQIQKLETKSGKDLYNWLVGFFAKLNNSQQKWFRRLILHDLQSGFNITQVNNVWKKIGVECIEVFTPPQLAQAIKLSELDSVDYPVIASYKYDGVRCIIKKELDRVTFTSRNGKQYNNMQQIEKQLLKINQDFIVDGEIVARGEGTAGEKFQKLTTVLQRKDSSQVDVELELFVFDVIEWQLQDYTVLSQENRSEFIHLIFRNLTNIYPERYVICYNAKEVEQEFNTYVSVGGEGLILKKLDSKYEFDSRNNWYKIKPILEEDFIISGWGYGSGKSNKEKVGRIIVDVNGIGTSVGSGLSDEIVSYMTQEKDNLIGRTVEIHYTEKTIDGKLRHPRFVKFKDDQHK